MRNVHLPLEGMNDPIGFGYRPYVAIVDDVLSPEECATWMAHMEALKPAPATINRGSFHEMNTDIRKNDRVMWDDHALAADIWRRIRHAVPDGIPERKARVRTDTMMTPVGLNERWRGYRYGPGQYFAPHFDGCWARNKTERSVLTLILYLNEGCVGGETGLLDFDLAIAPRRGACLLFEHAIYHEGKEVRAGLKYALRTDVMYREIGPSVASS